MTPKNSLKRLMISVVQTLWDDGKARTEKLEERRAVAEQRATAPRAGMTVFLFLRP